MAAANLLAAAVTMAVSLPLMLAAGVEGAVAAMVLGGFTLTFVYLRTYRRSRAPTT